MAPPEFSTGTHPTARQPFAPALPVMRERAAPRHAAAPVEEYAPEVRVAPYLTPPGGVPRPVGRPAPGGPTYDGVPAPGAPPERAATPPGGRRAGHRARRATERRTPERVAPAERSERTRALLARRSGPGRARRDARARSLLVIALWSLLLLVSWTWEADRGVQDLLDGATRLTSVGRLTGLLSSALLLAQVLLMARLPVLENAVGRDRLVRMHRIVGFVSFDLMLVHIAAITYGYAGGRLDHVIATLTDLTLNSPGMLLAVLGTVALVLVVVTSLRAARRRLRYESWHLIHLYAYLGAGLALPHQLWTGQEFQRRPLVTLGWWAAWAATAAAVVGWRVLLPIVRSLRHDIRVEEVVREAPGVLSVHMSGRDLDRLAEPGQFLVWRFLGRRGWTRANPYSISAAPTYDRLRITVREAGDGSRSLADLEPGTRVLIEGAYGRLSGRARTRRRLAFIGAGAGLAPLRSLAEGLSYAPGEAILLERYTDRPFLPHELEWLARDRGLRLVRLPGRRRSDDSWVGKGYAGYTDAEVLRGWIPDLIGRDVFLCGPPAWAQSVRRAALDAGLPSERLHVEAFGW